MKTVCLLLLSSIAFSAHAQNLCGLSGDLQTRVNNCAQKTKNFSLVSRYATGKEIYIDNKTGIVWSETLNGEYSYHYDKVSTICQSAKKEFAGLNLKWKLPSIYNYFDLIKANAKLPNTKGETLWSSTSDKFYVNSRYIFESSEHYEVERDGGVVFRHLEVELPAKVKCIAETK